MQLDEMKDYLLSLSISDKDKRYVLNFCRKLKYLETLRDKASKDTGENIFNGYGDINSNICFIFNNPSNFNVAKSLIQEKLDLFDVNFWQIYVTFINKINKDYPLKYDMICSELSAVRPKALYVFDTDKKVYDTIMSAIIKLNAPIPERSFFIDMVELGSEDEEVKQRLWHTLRYLINYKPLDIK